MESWQFAQRQSLPYEAKLVHAEKVAYEFRDWAIGNNKNLCVSIGGLDSLTLYKFLIKLGIDATPVSVSVLEDITIQRIHRDIPGMVFLKPIMSKVDVIKQFWFPVISKEKAGKIEMLQNPTDKNTTVRHAIMTGETGKQGGFRKGTRMRLPQKWLNLFGGPENESYGTSYKTAPFKVSNKCCYYLKEKPCNDWQKNNNMVPYLGMMASEGGQREKALFKNGCNYFGKTVVRSAPFAIFHRQDLLRLAVELEVPVPEIYGSIETQVDGTLHTTKAQRTGCSMCGFGIHIEKRPHRFDRLRETNLKEWEFWMYQIGWGEVLNYIGVEWETPYYVEESFEQLKLSV